MGSLRLLSACALRHMLTDDWNIFHLCKKIQHISTCENMQKYDRIKKITLRYIWRESDTKKIKNMGNDGKVGDGMLTINTLGKFQVMNAENVMNEDDIRSPKLTNLLVYLIVHRDRTLTLDDMAEALWQEEETNNPSGALKNLMYRLRNLMKQYLGNEEFILTNRGSYRWNPDVAVTADFEEFEKMYQQSRQKNISDADAIHFLEKSVDIYQGDFMAKIAEMNWIITLNTYYHSMYLSCVKKLCELYAKSELYDELDYLCSQAINYENLDEDLYYYLILARIKRNKMNLAMESYEKACRILKDQLGIRNSPKLCGIYDEILKMNKSGKADKMEEVCEDIAEENPEGVFMCGYPVFREIYRLEARKISRLGEAEHILLLSLNSKDDESGAVSQADHFRIKNAMPHLEETLKKSLRIGDVAAQYSDSQYVILLPACTYENGMLVANRIVSKFYNDNKIYRNLKIKINLEEVEMAGNIIS